MCCVLVLLYDTAGSTGLRRCCCLCQTLPGVRVPCKTCTSCSAGSPSCWQSQVCTHKRLETTEVSNLSAYSVAVLSHSSKHVCVRGFGPHVCVGHMSVFQDCGYALSKQHIAVCCRRWFKSGPDADAAGVSTGQPTPVAACVARCGAFQPDAELHKCGVCAGWQRLWVIDGHTVCLHVHGSLKVPRFWLDAPCAFMCK